ncbi:hypothetical protein BDU57DRAFT_524352 [Ampelomyces quisqualis]|uniref:RGS domain-containing protein n=1 Tax=Ampelomyces quisqualis TaxID=50730 RepID=A0A6A5Q6V1_AMPQU|nr:hypothetical protein BDU57DRAFT_524352 [Ampelomyces quisqualis]
MAHLRLDRIGWAYLSVFIVWNVALASGMAYLWKYRQQPSLRMRKIPLLLAGVFLLHVYAAVCLLAYPVGAYFSCSLEFWSMSIWLPFGIALFHAANSQFLHLASRQKHFAHMSTLRDHPSIDEEKAAIIANSRRKRVFAGLERADNINQTLKLIALGMIIQLCLTLFIFFGSRKFHQGYGLFNYTVKGTGMIARLRCSKGWEWWLSIVWQLFWAWIYAPYLLWKSRSVRDVHGWRLQTICCCVAGLPASPLWLMGLYVPQFARLNAVMPPPVWFSIFVFFMEVFAIGFPIGDVIRGNTLRQETLDAIADWERRQAASGLAAGGSLMSPSALSDFTTLKSVGDITINSKASLESNKSDMLTMAALENALRTSATPLLEFAALKDFSGENVSFLTHVADWRCFWFSPKVSTAEHRRKQFTAAARIFAHFISLEFSEFPINISSKEMKRLHHVFAPAATLLYGNNRGSISSSDNDATPFDDVLPDDIPDPPLDRKCSYSSTSNLRPTINLDTLGRANLRAVSRLDKAHVDHVLAEMDIPEDFTEMVFDLAESEIKYLVLTNTWPKFVNAGRANSQISKSSDENKENQWKKVLCVP